MLAQPLAAGAELRSLEPWQAAEFATHVERARPALAPWIPWGSTVVDTETARELLQRYADNTAKDGARIYGIWVDGTLAGGVLFRIFEPKTGSCEIGVWLDPQFQGRGLITQASQLLIDWAFRVRGMVRIEWCTASTNTRSIAAAKRLGMTLDGTLRQSFEVGGVRHDIQVWSLLPSDVQTPSP